MGEEGPFVSETESTRGKGEGVPRQSSAYIDQRETTKGRNQREVQIDVFFRERSPVMRGLSNLRRRKRTPGAGKRGKIE